MLRIADTLLISSCLLAFAPRQRRAKIRIWKLNTYGIFNDIFQSKINVLHLSKFLRSISWEPRVMIGWASQMDARETLCCHMFLQSKNMFSHPKSIPPKKERTFDFNRYKLPHGTKIPFQKMKGWNSFPKNALSSMCRRWLLLRWRREKICNNTTTKKRTQKREKLARASQNSPYSNPLCPFFPSSFHSFNLPCGEERYKNARFVSINRKKANDEEKSSHPSTHYHR